MISANSAAGKNGKPVLICAGLLALVLALLFWRSLTPEGVVFANDAPLGYQVAEQNRMPAVLTGMWGDLTWLGGRGPSPSPTFSTAVWLGMTPLIYAKILCPVSLFVLGICACFSFRQLKLAPLACVLGGFAAALNSDAFANACWGQVSRPLTLSAAFLALAALQNGPGWRSWIKTVLAGMAVGVGIMEGFDVGAIFSLFIGAYVLFQAWVAGEGSPVNRTVRGGVRLALVAGFAAFVAWATLSSLIGTQVKGIVGMGQDAETKARRWDEATQWSLPKVETLNLIVPGLFGFRQTPPASYGGNYWGAIRAPGVVTYAWPTDGGHYWGTIGQTPGYQVHHQGARFGGGGFYGGVLVVTIAAWALLQSLRKKDSPFTGAQRKFIWFWAGVAFICLLLAFGRHAPFYQLFYALPHASNIRNPIKFMHVFGLALLVLFGYGIHGLVRCYLEKPLIPNTTRNWWARAGAFDRKWTAGSVLVVAAGLLGWLIYASSRASLEKYLQTVDFDAGMASTIAGFSIRQVGWFIVRLVAAFGVLALILSGRFSGPRTRWGGILLGALLLLDQVRAVTPFIVYWDYPQKYATNPVIDLLRQKPYEHRVSIFPMEGSVPLKGLYEMEWKQHLFLYYNIQCLDIIQMPRMPEVYAAYEGALAVAPVRLRRWELTNTRYLLAPAAWLESINQQLDPDKRRFRIVMQFDVVPRPGVLQPTLYEQLTAVSSTNGPYAVFEFAGALPRAKLYANWQVSTNDPATLQPWVQTARKSLPRDMGDVLAHLGTNDQATLQELAGKSFDPEQTVLLANPLAAPAPASVTNQSAGTVDFVSYKPKHVVLRAEAAAPAVLLLNDSYDPDWQVSVDGKPEPLLRCNYVMRGVYVTPGPHTVEFQFRPPPGPLYVSLVGVALGFALIGILVVAKPKPALAEDRRNKPSKSEKPRK